MISVDIFMNYLHTTSDSDLLHTGITGDRKLQITIHNNNLFNGSKIIKGAGYIL
jgi:hypothetical protein